MKYNDWVNAIREQIKYIGDVDFQRKSWFGEDPTLQSSPTEIVNGLYDVAFEEFITEVKGKLSSTVIESLSRLDNMLEEYEPPEVTPESILQDENWHKIVNHANHCLRIWAMEE